MPEIGYTEELKLTEDLRPDDVKVLLTSQQNLRDTVAEKEDEIHQLKRQLKHYKTLAHEACGPFCSEQVALTTFQIVAWLGKSDGWLLPTNPPAAIIALRELGDLANAG